MADLAFTGERFLPACTGEIAYEHWHRYAFARRFVAGKRVLDAACGEGYGSALLGEAAASVVGVDIDGPTIAHAGSRYGSEGRVRFIEGSCTELPLPDASIDVVVIRDHRASARGGSATHGCGVRASALPGRHRRHLVAEQAPLQR
jgi:SAM-dependent methyltransferase